MKLNGQEYKFNVIDCKVIHKYLEGLGKDEYVSFTLLCRKFGFSESGYSLGKIKRMLPKNFTTYGKRNFFSSEKNIKSLNKLISNTYKV